MPSQSMRRRLYVAATQLILCLSSMPTLLGTSQISPKPLSLNILYLTDIPLTQRTKASLAQFESNLTKNARLNQTVQLTRKILPKNATMLEALRELNRGMRWEETHVVILNMNDKKIQKMILCGYNGLVFDIRTRPKAMEQESNNVFIIKPSFIRLHEATKMIFGEIGYTKTHDVQCFSRQNSDVAKMKQTLEDIKASAHSFIFVKCLENLDILLIYANKIGLATSDFRWVFPGVIDLSEISKKLPRNVIAIDLPGSHDRFQPTGEENTLFLDDVLIVLEKTMKENYEELVKKEGSSSVRVASSFKRYIVNEKFSGRSGEVMFNTKGERSGEIYEIFELVRFNGDHKWLPIGSLEKGNVRILFNQWQLESKKQEKPVLRVVTRLKPPYIMLGPAQKRKSTGECELGRLCRQYAKTGENNSESTTFPSDIISNKPGNEHDDYSTTFEYKCCSGLIMDFLGQLEKDVGFDSKIHLVKDGMRGTNDPKTQQWNGMIGELIRNEADIAAYTLTITAKRSKVVDFSYPYADIANGILVSTQPVSHDVWDFVFLETFSANLWLAFFISIQIVISILWLAERLRQRRRFLNFPRKRDNSMSCAQIINYTWSLVFQKASEEVGPNTLGGRTVAALFAFCTIIACSSFTANLAAIKVTKKDGIAISGIHDPKFQTGEIKVGTLENSANLDFFRDSTDPSLQRIYKRLKGNVVSSYEAAAKKILSREWTAFIADTPQLAHLVSKQSDCGLKISGDPFFFSGYGIALRKNSTWNSRLSIAITSLVREGFVTRLQEKWLGTGCGNVKQPGMEKMGTNDIGGAFLIVSFGCIASGVFLLLEYVVWYVLVRKQMVQASEAEEKNQKEHTCFGAFIKILTLWGITRSADHTDHQTLSEPATLKSFRTLNQEDRCKTCNVENFKINQAETEH